MGSDGLDKTPNCQKFDKGPLGPKGPRPAKSLILKGFLLNKLMKKNAKSLILLNKKMHFFLVGGLTFRAKEIIYII